MGLEAVIGSRLASATAHRVQWHTMRAVNRARRQWRRVRDGWWLVGLIGLTALGAGLVAGCSGDEGATSGDLTTEEILTRSSAAMAEVGSAEFTITQAGDPIFFDGGGQIAFVGAEGRFTRPSSADALVSVEAFGFAAQVGAVAIDGTLWFTNPITSEWEEAPDGFDFDPADLFDPDVGIPAVLAGAATTATPVDSGPARDGDDGSDSGGDGAEPGGHRARLTVPAERAASLTGGLVAVETEAQVWIDPETFLLRQMVLDLPVGTGGTTWTVVFTAYDTDVTIEPPEVGSTG